jgi:hypothetical protein
MATGRCRREPAVPQRDAARFLRFCTAYRGQVLQAGTRRRRSACCGRSSDGATARASARTGCASSASGTAPPSTNRTHISLSLPPPPGTNRISLPPIPGTNRTRIYLPRPVQVGHTLLPCAPCEVDAHLSRRRRYHRTVPHLNASDAWSHFTLNASGAAVLDGLLPANARCPPPPPYCCPYPCPYCTLTHSLPARALEPFPRRSETAPWTSLRAAGTSSSRRCRCRRPPPHPPCCCSPRDQTLCDERRSRLLRRLLQPRLLLLSPLLRPLLQPAASPSLLLVLRDHALSSPPPPLPFVLIGHAASLTPY